jgi:hypothetical protein
MDMRSRSRLLLSLLIFAAVISLSLVSPVPPTSGLPDIALGFPLLLHLERALAVIALLSCAALVFWRATRGEFPLRFAQVEYESSQLIRLGNHEQRIRGLEEALGFRSGLENGDEPI